MDGIVLMQQKVRAGFLVEAIGAHLFVSDCGDLCLKQGDALLLLRLLL